jgi:methanogenic corrinoid protein MtbC1
VAYLRVKKAGGRAYAYLVESRWNQAAGHPRQRVLAYLGRLDRLRVDAVPVRYRTPPVLRALDARRAAEQARRRTAAVGEGAGFLRALLDGDRAAARRRMRRAVRDLGAEAFYSAILVPGFHEIGLRTAGGELSISAEHLATGLAAGLLAEMTAGIPEVPAGAPEVVLCVPDGESHVVALQIAEAILRRKGYRTLNVAGSAPTRSVAEFVRARRPVGALISVTLPARLPMAQTLARQLRWGAPGIRLAIGGQATASLGPGAHLEGVDLVRGPVEEYLAAWPEAGERSATP